MRNQLINRLANDYTKDIVKNPDGKIFDHIVAMVDANPEIVNAVNSHEALLEAAKIAYADIDKERYSSITMQKLFDAIALAEGK